jgi:hypothetical protein
MANRNFEDDDYYEVDPPEKYDEGRIRRDLVRLELRGLSIEPYLKTLARKGYYNRNRAKIEALTDLVHSSRSLISSLIEFGLEVDHFKDLDAEIKFVRQRRRKDWQIQLDKQELEHQEIKEKLSRRQTRANMEWERDEKKHELLMKKLDQQLEKLEKETKQPEGNTSQGKRVHDTDKEDAIRFMDQRAELKEKELKLRKDFEKKFEAAGYSSEQAKEMADQFIRELYEDLRRPGQ